MARLKGAALAPVTPLTKFNKVPIYKHLLCHYLAWGTWDKTFRASTFIKSIVKFHLGLFWRSVRFNDPPCFQHWKLIRGCAKLRPSHRQLVEENSSKCQGETQSLQKLDRGVGWGLNSPKTCICTRQNIMGSYSCLVCLGSVQPSLTRWHFWAVASSQSTLWSALGVYPWRGFSQVQD